MSTFFQELVFTFLVVENRGRRSAIVRSSISKHLINPEVEDEASSDRNSDEEDFLEDDESDSEEVEVNGGGGSVGYRKYIQNGDRRSTIVH